MFNVLFNGCKVAYVSNVVSIVCDFGRSNHSIKHHSHWFVEWSKYCLYEWVNWFIQKHWFIEETLRYTQRFIFWLNLELLLLMRRLDHFT